MYENEGCVDYRLFWPVQQTFPFSDVSCFSFQELLFLPPSDSDGTCGPCTGPHMTQISQRSRVVHGRAGDPGMLTRVSFRGLF